MLVLFTALLGLGSVAHSTNANVWLRADSYPKQPNGAVASDDARIELTVDAAGKVLRCSIVNTTPERPIDPIFCRIPLAKAHFRPALDEAGMPVASVVARNFYSRFDQYAHGSPWVDYVLQVDPMPRLRFPFAELRIVIGTTDAVESCVIQTGSGSSALDRLACLHTRTTIKLAPTPGADGLPVRTLRIIRVGFVFAAARPTN